MNFYVVVEGKAERIVYKSWIPLVNPGLEFAESVSDVHDNNFHLVSGQGYPYYLDVIDDAICDVNTSGRFDRLIIAVDSEDLTREEKLVEILEYVKGKPCVSEIRVVIQHFCLECWALGNRRVVRKQPTSETLRTFKRFFDVRVQDPELLPAYTSEGLNRSQFAERYLRVALNERNRNITYSKGAPNFIGYYKYFGELTNRMRETRHILSFGAFLDAFV